MHLFSVDDGTVGLIAYDAERNAIVETAAFVLNEYLWAHTDLAPDAVVWVGE